MILIKSISDQNTMSFLFMLRTLLQSLSLFLSFYCHSSLLLNLALFFISYSHSLHFLFHTLLLFLAFLSLILSPFICLSIFVSFFPSLFLSLKVPKYFSLSPLSFSILLPSFVSDFF